MNTWKRELKVVETNEVVEYEIVETEFDHDLHTFEVYQGDEKLGEIVPATIEDMNDIIAELNDGACPIGSGWEDGMGNTCSIEGW